MREGSMHGSSTTDNAYLDNRTPTRSSSDLFFKLQTLDPTGFCNLPTLDPAQFSKLQVVDRCHPLLQRKQSTLSQERLASEATSIYAGLEEVERKCIIIDRVIASAPLELENWQAGIALHRILLHEYVDFFKATQHPSASASLRHLPIKHSMLKRMWNNGIEAFLQ
ncbi:uncharacterized protein BDZ99DRAFT_528395 [Mytilinidion resinicola]|uniref:Uncharacterized protein n=1 Tax=Mytilinidion resinicola TaxID=574789 RepID=A0A6A6Y0W4_9PEZI|nr:uncharacterized protein BDZ99DRAFT_528395 [Mytilinidion resinicola]KAF2801447.1 hypothetical protein BDZ99DRAFT_528395 [Mytilinidion resinicola]